MNATIAHQLLLGFFGLVATVTVLGCFFFAFYAHTAEGRDMGIGDQSSPSNSHAKMDITPKAP